MDNTLQLAGLVRNATKAPGPMRNSVGVVVEAFGKLKVVTMCEDLHADLLAVDSWTPRSTPVLANDGDLFWVANEKGAVVAAHWNAYQKGGVFQNLLNNDEGMCGFAVTHYQPITKPEAPKS